ncbi:MAG TPA: OsmC family peroxiredoxin [Acidimicrobiales bacterium]|nr:OsmC family peroxiredoxin [Acidimicrobiales bacterium]
MPTRSARTIWTGGLQDGSGRTELVSSGLGTYDVSFPRRSAESAEGYTSPEELIAAAHASCYAMALSGGLGRAGATSIGLSVEADVSLGPDPAGGFRISGVVLRVRGRVEGIDETAFLAAAEAAKAGCPVSKALTGTEITLDAALD